MRCFYCCIIFALIFFSSEGMADPQVKSVFCKKINNENAINGIVNEVFQSKSIQSEDSLGRDFFINNKDVNFVICDEPTSYDTIVDYAGKVVIIDSHMIHFLFAQSRALVVGRYISLDNQFAVYDEVVTQFVRQKEEINSGPISIIEKKALSLGVTQSTFEKWLADTKFQEREQKLFLTAIYFLVMHERCHIGLGHGPIFEKIKGAPDPQKTDQKQLLELAADHCALDIINSDEAQFTKSPMSFFGVLMTVATQAIIANHPLLRSDRSHPSVKSRMDKATDRVVAFVSGASPSSVEQYTVTIKGTKAHFDALLDELATSH